MSCQQCREADRIAIEELGIPSLTLMENAGRGCADTILELNIEGEVVVLCGRGNNGGDGFVIARHLHAEGKNVKVILLAKPHTISGDARENLERLKSSDLAIIELPVDSESHQVKALLTNQDGDPPGVIVDSMLGTGARGGLRTPYDQVVKACNAMEATRVAVDLPSGLDGNTGQVENDAFRADLTCTFIAAKHGMNTDNGRRYCGEVRLVDIGLPKEVLVRVMQ
ncbi:NAD(P)H-hydrate epimerase [Mariniblastus sp.]|nr:NAD(P)H-hydrate epimerase [Mariniblastus sp.]